jgi:hypothetical protein
MPKDGLEGVLSGLAVDERTDEGVSTAEQVVAEERRRLGLSESDGEGPWALCLSGGGIRSATFGLGVLQGLAHTKLLSRFHYLSTVSGGGYIGSWLSRWIRDEGLESVESELGNLETDEPLRVKRLRAYSNYLSPVLGLSADFFALISIFLRNLFVTWSGLIPALCLIVLIPRIYVLAALMRAPADSLSYGSIEPAIATMILLLLTLGGAAAYRAALLSGKLSTSGLEPLTKARRGGFFIVANAGAALPLFLMAWPSNAWLAVLVIVLHGAIAAAGGVVYCRSLGVSATLAPAASRMFLVGWLLPAFLMAVSWSLVAFNNGAPTQASPSDLLVGLLAFVLPTASACAWLADREWRSASDSTSTRRSLTGAALGVGSALPGVLAALAVTAGLSLEAHATFVAPAILLCIWTATAMPIAIAKDWIGEPQREWWARCGGWCLRAAGAWIVLFGFVLYVPGLIFQIPGVEIPSLAGGGGLIGVLVSLVGYWSENGAKVKERVGGLISRLRLRLLDVAAVAFIVALFVLVCLLVHFSYVGLASQRRTPEARRGGTIALRHVEREIQVVELSGKLALEQAEGIQKADAARTVGGGRKADDGSKDAGGSKAPVWAGPEQRLMTLRRHGGEISAAVNRLSRLAFDVRESPETMMKLSESTTEALSKMVALEGASRSVDPEHAGSALTTAVERLASVAATFIQIAAADAEPPGHRFAREYADRLRTAAAMPVMGLLVGFGVLSLLILRFAGVNTFSLHGLYGNRLVRAYLGAARPYRSPDVLTDFDEKDNEPLWMASSHTSGGTRPFHVLNATLNLTAPRAADLAWQQRKAASFTFTPFRSGSDIVGYRSSEVYGGEQGVSMGRALAISGAAASPNMGYHSSPAVAFVMTFFNVRLGWWMPNPAVLSPGNVNRKEPLWGLVREALGYTARDTDYVYLSDGGHFDNLGLYEMVRRRCSHIVVVDASEDPNRSHEELEGAIRKVRVDFGASISFSREELCQPRRCTLGTIEYKPEAGSRRRSGTIYYLKPVVGGDEPFDVLRYACMSRARHQENRFPHESTTDQFFSESQFESYRALGLHTARALFKAEGRLPSESIVEECAKGIAIDPCVCGLSHGTDVKAAPAVVALPSSSLLSNGLQTWGQGAVLASVITVGGAVGAAGYATLRDATVAIAPDSEVKISEASLETLRGLIDGLKVPASPTPTATPVDPPPPSITPTPVPAVAVTLTLDETLRRNLGDLLIELKSRPSIDVSAITKAINGLKAKTDDPASPLRLDLTSISEPLGRILEQLQSTDPRFKARLQEQIALLKSIEQKLAPIAPRRNVRGTP